MASPSSPHVAILAFPFSSHAAVILSMARALAAEEPAASFSFLSTGASLATLRKEVACPANLRFVEIPDGMPEDVGAGMPVPRRMELFLAAAEAGGLAQGLEAARAEAGGARVSCVLADAFLWMAADAAAAAGARWVAIWTGASSCLVAHLNTDALRAAVGDQAASRADELLTSTPGLGSYRIRDLPDGVVSGNFNYVINLLLHRMALRLPRADAIALNTFPDLDPPDVTAALAAAIPQCLPVGPFHLLSTVGTDRAVPDPYGCLAWLDRRAPRTVAYVSFGTVASPPPAELHELAAGLEASGAPFLWSLKEELWPHLPPGFLDRTRETAGLVVTWAPQVAVLQHEAVGAFVTHAGWSSVLEGVTNAVPMACRPFFGDQRTNARSASNVWRVGTVFDGQMTNGAVAEAVKLLVTQEEGRRMRERARVLQTKVASAFEPDGGRRKNFEKLVNIVCGV